MTPDANYSRIYFFGKVINIWKLINYWDKLIHYWYSYPINYTIKREDDLFNGIAFTTSLLFDPRTVGKKLWFMAKFLDWVFVNRFWRSRAFWIEERWGYELCLLRIKKDGVLVSTFKFTSHQKSHENIDFVWEYFKEWW